MCFFLCLLFISAFIHLEIYYFIILSLHAIIDLFVRYCFIYSFVLRLLLIHFGFLMQLEVAAPTTSHFFCTF